MINSINQALKRLLHEEIVGHSDLEILFEHPCKLSEVNCTKSLNLYLHEISENTSLRQDPFQVVKKPGERTGTRKRPFVRMNLGYVVTAQAPTVALEHELLTLALGALLRNQIIPPKFMEGAHPPIDPVISVAQSSNETMEHTALWRALGGTLRPSLSLLVVAPFDPFVSQDIKLVREMILGTGFLTDGPEAGRPHDLRELRVSVAGVVFDENLVPLAGATVSVVNRDETAITDDRGFYYLVNLPPGPCRLLFHRRGYSSSEHTTEASKPGLTNEIEPIVTQLKRLNASLESKAEAQIFAVNPKAPVYDVERTYPTMVAGRLRLPDGRPAAYIPVRLGDQRTVTDLEGRYRFYSREASDTVWATYPGIGEVKVEVTEGSGVLKDR